MGTQAGLSPAPSIWRQTARARRIRPRRILAYGIERATRTPREIAHGLQRRQLLQVINHHPDRGEPWPLHSLSVDNGICVRMGAPPGRSGSRRPARVSKAEQLDGWCPFVACGLSIGSSARANDHRWEVAMLGHEDEWRLAAIEQQLLHDHPTFVRRLTRRMW